MYGLDLFSGIGGLTRALEGYVTPVAYCEINQYTRKVLQKRMHSGDLPTAPIWDDVRTLKGADLPSIDIIYGGFPCQDISVAGRQRGLAGERSGLFFEIIRLVKEVQPKFIFLENVSNIRTKGLGRVLKELDSIGYDSRWCVLSASHVGAHHRRARWFLLAHARSGRSQSALPTGNEAQKRGGMVLPTWSSILWKTTSRDEFGRAFEPSIRRVANGIPDRLERTLALGNAVVPQQVREAFERLSGLKAFSLNGYTHRYTVKK
jgi:DNA (cytosine-5)-methyltransferase 1